jgi:hypothetical protein
VVERKSIEAILQMRVASEPEPISAPETVPLTEKEAVQTMIRSPKLMTAATLFTARQSLP